MKRMFLIIAMILFLSVPVFAMNVEFIPTFNTYNTDIFNGTYSGYPIDDAASGVEYDLYAIGVNQTSFTLVSPDGSTPYYWVYVSLHNANLNETGQLVTSPHDITFLMTCTGGGGWYNFSGGLTKSWTVGYNLFRLTWNTEIMVPVVSEPPYDIYMNSPTGKDLYVKQQICTIAVDGSTLEAGDWVSVHVWAQNPDKAAFCNIDPTIQYVQSAVLTIVDINLQILQMLFQILVIVIVLGSIFGIPLLVFKLINMLIDELRGRKKRQI